MCSALIAGTLRPTTGAIWRLACVSSDGLVMPGARVTSIQIGDVHLADDGARLILTSDEQQSSSTWTVQGASLAVGWLLGWITKQQGGSRDMFDKTLRQL